MNKDMLVELIYFILLLNEFNIQMINTSSYED
jgi:hypothetical protein